MFLHLTLFGHGVLLANLKTGSLYSVLIINYDCGLMW